MRFFNYCLRIATAIDFRSWKAALGEDDRLEWVELGPPLLYKP